MKTRWIKNNPDKFEQGNKNYYNKNSERIKVKVKSWRKENKEKVTASERERRRLIRKATPKWANKFFLEEAIDLARLRTKMLGFLWHVDHIIPFRGKRVCGLNNEFNIQVIPAVENSRKSNKFIE